MKPIIGITCNYDYRDAVGLASHMGADGQDWIFLAEDYIRAVEAGGGIPLVIPQYKEPEEALDILNRIDGLVISGGHDVNPQLYGQRVKSYCGTLMPQRDAQDILLTQKAYALKLPILGICRGIQILCTAFGGDLYQDLKIEGHYEEHFTTMLPRNKVSHQDTLTESSRLKEIFGEAQIGVNSFHHQAVHHLPANAVATAKSEDGVVEALEFTGGHPFTIGVQWHPEMMFDNVKQLKLLQAFVAACTKA